MFIQAAGFYLQFHYINPYFQKTDTSSSVQWKKKH